MIKEYIQLCKIFGGSYDLVQTNGGNISIKSGNEIIIKRSGFKMLETELNKGYVICEIDKIKQKILEQNENINNTIIYGEGTPSIETFFHLLPKKYIVHLHPIKMLQILSIENWKEELDNLYYDMNTSYIEYKKPGLELSNIILNLYNNESIIFLQNHGIIICSDNIDDIYIGIDKIINKYHAKYNINVPSTNILFMKQLYSLLPDKIIKSSLVNNITNDRYFYKLSPDMLLYLGERPIILESSGQNIEEEIKKYLDVKIIIYNELIYCISNSYSNLKSLEEMIQTYYLVIKCNNNSNLFHEISNEESLVLNNWDKEKLRLQ